MPAPAPLLFRHIALRVRDLAQAEAFYVNLLGLSVAWRPDADNVYLSSGSDSVALHRVATVSPAGTTDALDHLGFFVPRPEDVDGWSERLVNAGARIDQPPRTHRDGSRSLYARDPEGNVVQILHYPIADPPP